MYGIVCEETLMGVDWLWIVCYPLYNTFDVVRVLYCTGYKVQYSVQYEKRVGKNGKSEIEAKDKWSRLRTFNLALAFF